MTDPAGDAEVSSAGTAVGPGPGQSNADLVGLAITETEGQLRFDVTFESLPDVGFFSQGSTECWVLFSHGAIDYGIFLGRFYGASATPVLQGHLATVQDRVPTPIKAIPVSKDGATLSVTLSKLELPDERGVHPTKGTSLENVQVTTSGGGIVFLSPDETVDHEGQGALRWRDVMPDEGTGSFPFTYGIDVGGPLILTSDDPFRVSNGGDRSFIFHAELHNPGEVTEVTLEATNVPPGWTVQFPQTTATLDAGQTVTFPLVVTTTGNHDHGSRATFVLEAAAVEGTARLLLGVHYPEIPQPAGHHDRLYFHTRAAEANQFAIAADLLPEGGDSTIAGYMNAQEDDPTDTGQAIPSAVACCRGNLHNWSIPLDPGLAMGLSFTKDSGLLEMDLSYPYAMADGTLTGEILVGDQTVARLAPVSGIDFTASTVSVTTQIAAVAETIDYRPGSTMVLQMQFESGAFTTVPAGPERSIDIEPGASMTLPLEEYYEPVADLTDTQSLRFERSIIRLPVNTGEHALFSIDLISDVPRDIRFEIEGPAATDVVINAPERIEGRAALQVLVPASDRPHTLVVIDAGNEFVRDAIVLDTQIDDSIDYPDASLSPRTGKESPAVGVVVGLVAIALARRML